MDIGFLFTDSVSNLVSVLSHQYVIYPVGICLLLAFVFSLIKRLLSPRKRQK